MKNCNCNYKDSCTCPRPEDCAISNIIANTQPGFEEDSVYTGDLSKNRETSRKRHHNDVRAKEKSLKSANILSSKADRLPAKAPSEEVLKANTRACKALKKSDRFRKQNMLQEQKKHLTENAGKKFWERLCLSFFYFLCNCLQRFWAW